MSRTPEHAGAARRRRPRSLALAIVEDFGGRISEGAMTIGDKLPTEAEIMASFGVSRTVVREALSRLQASGMVETRHGIGTFVVGRGGLTPMQLPPEQLATLRDVVAVLELRIGLEAEAAALAAGRRSDDDLAAIRAAQAAFLKAIDDDADTVAADRALHLQIARATGNPHFEQLMGYLGAMLIPRARLNTAGLAGQDHLAYVRRVHVEHENIVDAIANGDPESARAAMRTHLSNSRERLRRAEAALAAS